ncbi:MAG: hypothetical protein EOT05_03245 [Candidatus Microsaccharimonas sossegonensis]|uniref:Magnesium transport protein CorA n=1 Tax=Candidatus Microsaccharimonas sossegonensis TaxID=2506948 RepID=A0A4Q0AJ86_9BACT|nr:MAG: hypothetical protein EOT05_03245 [Candidatus Microsaccharimonas sossegonensis]
MSKPSHLPAPQKLHNVLGMLNQQPGNVILTGHSSVIHQQFKGFKWLDFQNPKIEQLQEIAEKYELHDLHIAQAHTKNQISQVTVEEKYIFLILHFPHKLQGERRITSSQVNIFLGKNYLITIHDQNTPTIRECFNEHKDHTKDHSPGKIVFHIIEHLLKEVEVLLADVSTDLDKIEERVFNDATSDAFGIGILRQKIMRLLRTLASQRGILAELDEVIDMFTGERLARYYKSNTNLNSKLLETVEEAKESIEIYQDAHFTSSTEQTNKSLKALTLVFTLTIPAALISAIYGMNVTLPGGIGTGSWTFLGDYTMLKLIVAASVLSAIGMLLYFKYKKWS